jgi:hypothetical protein
MRNSVDHVVISAGLWAGLVQIIFATEAPLFPAVMTNLPSIDCVLGEIVGANA